MRIILSTGIIMSILLLWGSNASAQVTAFFGSPQTRGDGIAILSKPGGDKWGFGNIDTMRVRTFPAKVLNDGPDSTACPIVRRRDFENKIAVAYRSPALPERARCTFDIKAKHMQDRGAKGLIMIDDASRIPYTSETFSASDTGLGVFIPIIFVTVAEGRRILARLRNGDSVSIGTLAGSLSTNLKVSGDEAAVFPYQHYPSEFYGTAAAPINDLNQNLFKPEINVMNVGKDTVRNAFLSVQITRELAGIREILFTGGDSIKKIAPFAKGITPGDTLSFNYKKFDPAAYPYNRFGTREGKYTLTYTIRTPSGLADELPEDNTFSASAYIDRNYLATAELELTGRTAKTKSSYFAAVAVGAYQIGVAFETYDAAMPLDSLGTAVTVPDGVDITQESAQLRIYEWDDANENGVVAESEISNLVGVGDMDLSDPASEGKFQWVPMAEPANNGRVVLPPGRTYIMMFEYQGTNTMYVAFENRYNLSVVNTQDSIIRGRDTFRSLTPLNNPSTRWFVGFVDGTSVALAAKFGNLTSAKPKQAGLDMVLYPQPASDLLKISLPKAARQGTGTMIVTDLSGKQVLKQTVRLDAAVSLPTSSLAPGLYNLRIETGKATGLRKFAVVR